jgi:hypothetical protein
MGQEIPNHRAKLATKLGACHRAVRTRGHFPTDEAAMKLLCLVLRQVAGKWKMPQREWCEAKTQFAIMFDERFFAAGDERPLPDQAPFTALDGKCRNRQTMY